MGTVSYKCPNCTAAILYDAAAQSFSCDYCGSQFDRATVEKYNEAQTQQSEETTQIEYEYITQGQEKVEAASLKESDKQQEQEVQGSKEYERVRLYSCPSCGANIITEQSTAATACFYCHAPVVLADKLTGDAEPNLVIPFKISKEQALDKFNAWIKKKRFLPKGLFGKDKNTLLQGVYFPYWLVDSKLNAFFSGTGEVISTWTTGNHRHVKTDTYQVYREGILDINEIGKNALSANDRSLAEGIFPYDMKDAEPFLAQYLLGFQAEQRDLYKEDITPLIQNDLAQFSTQLLSNTVTGYKAVQPQNTNYRLINQQWRYILLPVWAVTYQHGDKRYFYAMNGQTGKVVGEVPISKAKLALCGVGIASAIAALLSIGGFFL